jgi:diguanylate cyclase (GGDEF)-like protein
MQGHVLGALALETSYEAAFTETDLRLLTSFAATATAAIHNAQLHAKVQQLAITDGLTGLYNRRGFYEVGRREIDRALRYKRPLAAIMLDIDFLKSINDTHGHDAGDTVLCFVANTCHYDTRKVDIAGRYGGDEFVLLLPENGLFTAAGVAERLRSRIAETPIQYQNTTIDATISLGVVKLMPGIKDVEAMIKRADEALHAAKQAGRNRVEIR